VFAGLEFDTALDPFCGSGAVAYLLKCLGKSVEASDALEFNATAARALVANDDAALGGATDELIAGLPGRDCGACGAPTCSSLAEDIVMDRRPGLECVVLRGRGES